MDLNADAVHCERMQSTYDTLSSAADVCTTGTAAHSMAQPVMAAPALMPGLFAFQSLTPVSTMQPHVLSTSSQLFSECASSSLAASPYTVSAVNTVQSAMAPVLQSGMAAGILRQPVPPTLVQPSSAGYTHSNRVSDFSKHILCRYCSSSGRENTE